MTDVYWQLMSYWRTVRLTLETSIYISYDLYCHNYDNIMLDTENKNSNCIDIDAYTHACTLYLQTYNI